MPFPQAKYWEKKLQSVGGCHRLTISSRCANLSVAPNNKLFNFPLQKNHGADEHCKNICLIVMLL
jgi:hypothetical protein